MNAERSSVCAALKRVGLTVDDIVEVGGSVLEAGRPYLVGSLAQGFGNRGSDVDVHLFVPELERAAPPFLCFVGDVPVDIEHFPAGVHLEVLGGLDADVVDTPAGAISTGRRLERRTRTRLIRWTTALPLFGETPLFDEAQHGLIRPHLLRFALTRLVGAAAVAELVGLAGLDAGHAWRLCGRGLLDLACTVRGWPPIGDKWLPSRIRAAGLEPALVGAAGEVRSVERLVREVALLGVPAVDPLRATVIRNDPGAEVQRIGRQRFIRTRHGRIVEREPITDGSFAEVVGAVEPLELVELLRAGVVRVEVDDVLLSEELVSR
ncbi:hypothetical protein [Lentzea sp. NPDC051838]|uniref:hypothetical protein n=1 Tax=Lentzea sp. NPDC051838 TaxID=3154849 RepID=UPI00342CC3D3